MSQLFVGQLTVVVRDAIQEMEFLARILRNIHGQKIYGQKRHETVRHSDASSIGFSAFQIERECAPRKENKEGAAAIGGSWPKWIVSE